MSMCKWKMIDTRLPTINTYPLFPEMMAIIRWFLSMLPVTAKSWNPSPSTSGVTTGKEISVSECPAVGLWALHLAMPSNNTGKVYNLILSIKQPKYLTFVYQLNEYAASRHYRTCFDFVLEPSSVAYPKKILMMLHGIKWFESIYLFVWLILHFLTYANDVPERESTKVR